MKLHFIEAHSDLKVTIPSDVIDKLPEKICLSTTVQFVPQLSEMKKQLEAAGKEVTLLRALHSKYEGQLLGCGFTKFDYPEDAEAFLYVGDGLFHPKSILFAVKKKVFQYDPIAGKMKILEPSLVEAIEKKRKGALLTFLHKTEIGVLLSTKPGQNLMKHAFELPKMFPEKNFYFLVSGTLDFNQLPNFSFVECFVNTACNRLMDDADKFPKPVINLEDIPGNTVKNP